MNGLILNTKETNRCMMWDIVFLLPTITKNITVGRGVPFSHLHNKYLSLGDEYVLFKCV